MDTLAQLPLPIVRRLRDLRVKQLENQNKEMEIQQQQAAAKMSASFGNMGGHPQGGGFTPNIPSSPEALSELAEEYM